MGIRFTTSDFITKSKQLHNNKYDYSQTVYVNSRSNVNIICPIHGMFEQRAMSHLSGSGCPKCARIWSNEHRNHLQESSRKSRGMRTEEWVARAKTVHGDKYDYSQTVYVNQRTNVKIICKKHGLFEQKADSHIRGNGCRLCGLESEKHKGVHGWSDEQRDKTTRTCIERYGTKRYLDSVEGKEKINKIKSTPEFRNKMRTIIMSNDVQSKIKQTSLQRYGVTSAMKLVETIDKVGDTKRKNKTWRTSKPEEIMHKMLVEKFGETDVIRQYKEKRYQFHCDFYIKSLDLFIELNATWLHGGHWFDDNNQDDLTLLNNWLCKIKDGKHFYEAAIDVWTVRDVQKHQTAINNGLNYVVFWKNDLSDFKQWLKSEPLILNNIL
ncbi:hypothetical protein J6A31_07410 [bacterium]|nr:hypothetical protein [bacterium]